ncbi:DegT/DnrJ/EryC1/StrS family aminotransferase [Kitasatospora acidiphila]|uniref:DegT/DnrJ/EryC1/StrS family aminotransferase n=1 Tax=Kitasatospora acidiphila TaxID=2567942 RepID=A0A540VYX4_9ACTN|nr:DegT/DnrJ/EryC1/StrS family aminotransferase [Kitasatospora acidiphila]TQF01968.1 DegT/DnrJ/EryC1/StrS family aminotransferase [Kitasatospora acidiphila]
MIPFHSNSRQHADLSEALAQALHGVDLKDDSAFAHQLEKFEQKLADYCQVESVVSVASGSDALVLALRALNLPPGSEVITCDFGFYATAASIIMADLIPVFVDTAPGRMTMDLDAVRAAISPRTAAIVPVHLFGEAVAMPALQKLASEHSLAIVEDVAQALGATSNGQLVGSFGVAAAVSFNWSKHLSSFSNGGAILTNDAGLANRLRSLRSYGNEGTFHHTALGINSKLNPFEAALLSVKLPYLDGWIGRRREVADRYTSILSQAPQIITPSMVEPGAHVFHKYTIRIPDRDGLRKYLKDSSVSTLVCYPHLLHTQPAFAGRGLRAESFDHASRLVDEVLSLPVYPELMDTEIDFIGEAVLAHVRTGH